MTDEHYNAAMAPKNPKETNVQLQETMRVSDSERVRLNAVLDDIRSKADGTIEKTFFLKTLMGLEGYSLRLLTSVHREYLAGRRDSFAESEDSARSTRKMRPSTKF